jgi:hypothetical protein
MSKWYWILIVVVIGALCIAGYLIWDIIYFTNLEI